MLTSKPGVAFDEIRIRACTLQHAELLALHQPRAMRYHGCADKLSHELSPRYLSMAEAGANGLLRNDRILPKLVTRMKPLRTRWATSAACASSPWQTLPQAAVGDVGQHGGLVFFRLQGRLNVDAY